MFCTPSCLSSVSSRVPCSIGIDRFFFSFFLEREILLFLWLSIPSLSIVAFILFVHCFLPYRSHVYIPRLHASIVS